MATVLYVTSGLADVSRGENTAKADGTASGWVNRRLDPARGAGGATSNSTPTVGGPTSGIEMASSGTPFEFISPPLAAGVTISSAIVMNVWGSESANQANTGPHVIIERLDSQLNIVSTILDSENGTEFGTTAAAKQWSATPTSTTLNRGDRIRARILGNDVGTMGSGRTFTIFYNGATGGASGDTFLQFVEDFTFDTAGITGTTLWTGDRDAAGLSVAGVIAKSLSKAKLNTTQRIIGTNVAAGWAAPEQATDVSGGTPMEWYTLPLRAFTLGGRAATGTFVFFAASANIVQRSEIAVVDRDGQNPVIWAAVNAGGLGSSCFPAGDDLAVATGQRLRLRLYWDDAPAGARTAGDNTFEYNATNPADQGRVVVLPQKIEELGGFPFAPHQLLRRPLLRL